MAFWSKKKIIDSINKYFIEKKVTFSNNNSVIEFELFFNTGGYILYPYLKINEDVEELSIIINIKKLEASNINDHMVKLNSFNLKSKYFTAKINEDSIIYLEYNCKLNYDIAAKALDKILESLYPLAYDIDNL